MNKLLKKFIVDHKIPIQAIDDPEYLDYALGLFNAKERWQGILDLLKERFSGNEDNFLVEMANLREKLISLVNSTSGYAEFQKADMNQYAIKTVPGVRSDGVYKENFVNQEFFSIDLAEAGWQVMRLFKACPDIGWKEFVSKETDISYFIESKQFREVVLGNLNPKRQKTVERWIISGIRDSLPEILSQLVSQGDDEIIYSGKIDNAESIKEKYPNCHVKQFVLRGYNLKVNEKQVLPFFAKEYVDGSETTYHCVPSMYYLPITKLLRGQEIIEKDLLFVNQDHVLCKYLSTFSIDKIGRK